MRNGRRGNVQGAMERVQGICIHLPFPVGGFRQSLFAVNFPKIPCEIIGSQWWNSQVLLVLERPSR
jgi:hypothetical protein